MLHPKEWSSPEKCILGAYANAPKANPVIAQDSEQTRQSLAWPLLSRYVHPRNMTSELKVVKGIRGVAVNWTTSKMAASPNRSSNETLSLSYSRPPSCYRKWQADLKIHIEIQGAQNKRDNLEKRTQWKDSHFTISELATWLQSSRRWDIAVRTDI